MLLLVLVPVLFVLHFLGRPQRTTIVSSLALWSMSTTSTVPARRPRRPPPSCYLLTAFIVAAALAASQPMLRQTGSAPAMLIAIDTSASMAAISGEASALDRAVARARDLVLQTSPGTRLALASVSDRVDLLVGWTDNRRLLFSAMADLDVRAAATSQEELHADVAGLLADDASARLVYISDLADLPVDQESFFGLSEGLQIGVGVAQDNFAVSEVIARSTGDGRFADVSFQIASYAERDAVISWSLAVGGQPQVRGEATIAAGDRHWVRTTVAGLVGQQALVTLVTDDALDLDDHRWTIIDRQRRVDVAVSASLCPFLERAVLASPWVRSAPDRSSADVMVTTGPVSHRAVLRLWQPAPRSRVASIRAAATATLIPLPWPAGTLVTTAAVDQRRESPDDAVPLLVAGQQPVLYGRELADGQRELVFAFDLCGSSLVRTPAFPVLISDGLAWLARQDDDGDTTASARPLACEFPGQQEGSLVTVVDPDGVTTSTRLFGGRAVYQQANKVGIYLFQSGLERCQRVVNFPADDESDLRRAHGGEQVLGSPSSRGLERRTALGGRPLRAHFSCLALVALLTAVVIRARERGSQR